MTFDKLPIEGDLPVNKQNIIYFSCNPKYWVEYGQYLAKSTLYYNHHQVHVHVHIMYEQEEHNPKNYISDPGITYTFESCLLYTSPSPRDRQKSRMPSSA